VRRCAYLTLEDRGDFCIYDQLTFAPLHGLGWQVEEIPWTRASVDWSAYDVVVVRSTWDYQNDLPRFLSVLESIEDQTRLLNPLPICRWNAHKGYLAELERAGVRTVPTVFVAGLDAAALVTARKSLGQSTLVAKPAVGANADDAFVLADGDAAAQAEAIATLGARDTLIQPFLAAVVEEGEYSLFYFRRRYSHAICKQPAAGDFRVQEEHGGIIRPVTPDAATRAAAERCLAAIGEPLLYARIDLIRLADGRMAVMEVELIEPSLYFDQDPAAASRFANALHAMALHA
jgi:glutathione synthase/RimK-type ligase-like ATP-grasp enzyme